MILYNEIKNNRFECINRYKLREKIEKIWITVHITLRKEALTLQDDILLNGTLFLNCDEKKKKYGKY